MSDTLAFDVYGTLIDPLGVAAEVQPYAGEQTPQFAQLWREKQLEYSFRRGLMKHYVDFSVCTRQALDYTCARTGIAIPDAARSSLMERYRALPAFADVAPALAALKRRGHPMYAFSNGREEDVRSLMRHAGIADLLDGVVSVDDVKSFKPDPATYAHLTRVAGSEASATWLISSNPFDIIGAATVGWRTAWVQRDSRTVFDPWDVQPTLVVSELGELAQLISD